MFFLESSTGTWFEDIVQKLLDTITIYSVGVSMTTQFVQIPFLE